jgi:hypothetical protein
MAVVVIQEFEATPEEYDQVNEKLGEETPQGGILHAAVDLGGGRMRRSTSGSPPSITRASFRTS